MKRLSLLVAVLLSTSAVAIAQPVDPSMDMALPEASEVASPSPSPTVNPCDDDEYYEAHVAMCQPAIDDLINEGVAIANSDWKTLGGAIGGIISLVHLLVSLTKIGRINAYIKERKLKWVRPLLGAVLSFLLSIALALSTDMKIMPAIVMAVIGALGSAGVHELWTALKPGEKE